MRTLDRFSKLPGLWFSLGMVCLIMPIYGGGSQNSVESNQSRRAAPLREKRVEISAEGRAKQLVFFVESDTRYNIEQSGDAGWLDLEKLRTRGRKARIKLTVKQNGTSKERAALLKARDLLGNVLHSWQVLQHTGKLSSTPCIPRILNHPEPLAALQGTVSIKVEVSGKCRFRLTSEVDWLVPQNRDEIGNVDTGDRIPKDITVVVSENKSHMPRHGLLRFGDAELRIFQQGQEKSASPPSCAIEAVEPAGLSLSDRGGFAEIRVTHDPICRTPTGEKLMPQISVSWIRFEKSEAISERESRVVIRVSQNLEGERQSVLKFGRSGEKTVPVFQLSKPICRPRFTTSQLKAQNTGDRLPVQIEVADNCSWRLLSLPDWITADSREGVGPAWVTLTIGKNDDCIERRGSVSLGTAQLNVHQDGSLLQGTLEPDKIPQKGGETRLTIKAGTDCRWSLSSDVNWISLSPASGRDDTVVTVRVDHNTGDRRQAIISLGEQRLFLTQYGRDTPMETYRLRLVDALGEPLANYPVQTDFLHEKSDEQGLVHLQLPSDRAIPQIRLGDDVIQLSKDRVVTHVVRTQYKVVIELARSQKMEKTKLYSLTIRSELWGDARPISAGEAQQLPPGSYIVQARYDGQIHTEKIQVTDHMRHELRLATSAYREYRRLYLQKAQAALEQARKSHTGCDVDRGDDDTCKRFFLARYFLGRLMLDQGKKSSATEYLKEVIAIENRDAGRTNELIDHWARLQIAPDYAVYLLELLATKEYIPEKLDLCTNERLLRQVIQLPAGERNDQLVFDYLYHRATLLHAFVSNLDKELMDQRRKQLEDTFRWLNRVPMQTHNDNAERGAELQRIQRRWERMGP